MTWKAVFENPVTHQRAIAKVEVYNIVERGRAVANGYWVTKYVGGRMPEHRRGIIKDFGRDEKAARAYAELWNGPEIGAPQ
jgi:hypothetical protein